MQDRTSTPRHPDRRPLARAVRATGLVAIWLVLAGLTPTALGGAPAPEGPVTVMRSVSDRIDGWKRGQGGVQVLDSLLAERILLLRATAPSFEAAWLSLESSNVPIVIGTREQLQPFLPRMVRDSNGWAAITVSWGESRELSRSAVAVRIEWLRALHARYTTDDAPFLAALDELIIHEVYGHLTPVVEHGSAAYTCPDPTATQSLADSCVGRRELSLRAERDSVVASHELAARR